MKKIAFILFLLFSSSLFAQTTEETKEDLHYLIQLDTIFVMRRNVKFRDLKEISIRDKKLLTHMSQKYRKFAEISEGLESKMFYTYSQAFKYLKKRKYKHFYTTWKKAMKLRYKLYNL